MKEVRKLVQRRFQAGDPARQTLGGRVPGVWGHKASVAKVMDREHEWRERERGGGRGLRLEQPILEALVAIGGALAFTGGEWEHQKGFGSDMV